MDGVVMTRYVTEEVQHKCDRCHINCAWREMILGTSNLEPDEVDNKVCCPNCGLTLFVQLRQDKPNPDWVKCYYMPESLKSMIERPQFAERDT